jgi:hypothetical protein
MTSSRIVSWPEVNRFLTEVVKAATYAPLPIAGTPAWCELADTDMRKLIALAVAGEHHVLRCDLAQEAAADASKTIATAEDWPAIARQIRAGRGDAYVPRRKESA